jgi:hypothetical protein
MLAVTKFRKKARSKKAQTVFLSNDNALVAADAVQGPQPWRAPSGTYTLKRGKIVAGEKQLLLIEQPARDRKRQASDIRVVVPGFPQFTVPVAPWFTALVMMESIFKYNPFVGTCSCEKKTDDGHLVDKRNGWGEPASLVGEVEGFKLQIHDPTADFREPAFRNISDLDTTKMVAGLEVPPFIDMDDQGRWTVEEKNKYLRGGKVRLAPKQIDKSSRPSIEMRGVFVNAINRFNAIVPGETSREKQQNILKICNPEMSWVEMFADEVEPGPADVVISYSWDLPWDYLVAYCGYHFGRGQKVRIWIDIMATNQHRLLSSGVTIVTGPAKGKTANLVTYAPPVIFPGVLYQVKLTYNGTYQSVFGSDLERLQPEPDMYEVERIPEVQNYAGRTIAMPGSVKRLWCEYEFAWAVEVAAGKAHSLVYGYTKGELDQLLGEKILNKAEQLAQQDMELVVGSLLEIVDATWVEGKYSIEDDEDLDDEDEKKLDGQRCTLTGEYDQHTLEPAKGTGHGEKGELRIDGVLQYEVCLEKNGQLMQLPAHKIKRIGRCSRGADEALIRGTIENRLGGSSQAGVGIIGVLLPAMQAAQRRASSTALVPALATNKGKGSEGALLSLDLSSTTTGGTTAISNGSANAEEAHQKASEEIAAVGKALAAMPWNMTEKQILAEVYRRNWGWSWSHKHNWCCESVGNKWCDDAVYLFTSTASEDELRWCLNPKGRPDMVKYGYGRRAKFACKYASGSVSEYRNDEPATIKGGLLELDVCQHCGKGEGEHTTKKLHLGLWHGVTTHDDGSVRGLAFTRQELTNLDGFEILAKLKGLEHLDLVDNDRLTSLMPLRWLVQLKSLDLMGCTAITDLSPLAAMVALKELILPTGVSQEQKEALKKELLHCVVI